jgi:hypothetical protein
MDLIPLWCEHELCKTLMNLSFGMTPQIYVHLTFSLKIQNNSNATFCFILPCVALLKCTLINAITLMTDVQHGYLGLAGWDYSSLLSKKTHCSNYELIAYQLFCSFKQFGKWSIQIHKFCRFCILCFGLHSMASYIAPT